MADPTYPVIPLSTLLTKVQTGDILLFHGQSDESQKIEATLKTWFSHSAIAALHPADRRPMIWQAGPDPIEFDQDTNTSHGGAQCGWLDATLKYMASPAYNDAPYWRPLSGVTRDDAFEQGVAAAVNAIEGTAFPSLDDMMKEYQEGLKGIPGPPNTLFCAELVATMYQRMGVLPLTPPPNAYSPRSFSSEGDDPPLQGGATLGPVYAIDVNS